MVASPQNPPNDRPPETAVTPVNTTSQTSVIGKRVFMGGLAVIMLLSALRGCNRPQQQQSIAPQIQQASVATQPQTEAVETPQTERLSQAEIDRNVIRRNAFLGEAIESTRKQVEETICTRSEYFLKEADRSGQPMEAYLLNQLAQVNSLNQQETVKTAVFDGSAGKVAIARAYNGDALALLLALQTIYEGKGLTLCSVQPADSILSIQQYTDQAKLLQQQTAQSRLQQMTIGGQSNGSALP